MTMIWSLELPENAPRFAVQLLGTYAVRAFYSQQTLLRLLRCGAKPDLLLLTYCGPHNLCTQFCQYAKDAYRGPVLVLTQERQCHHAQMCVPMTVTEIELIQCIRFLLGQAARSTAELAFQDLQLDCEEDLLAIRNDNTTLHTEVLPVKEAKILRVLMRASGDTVARDRMLHQVWPDTHVTPRTLDTHISRLRQRLRCATTTIDAVYGQGYRLR